MRRAWILQMKLAADVREQILSNFLRFLEPNFVEQRLK